jgi:hypothetical protein
MNFFIGFFLFLDRAASFHFRAVETPSCDILTAFAGRVARGINFTRKLQVLFDRNRAANPTPTIP